jgi:hypothetical protein
MAGAVVATPGAIQSITTLASTTGIALALTLLPILEDQVARGPSNRRAPQGLVRAGSPFSKGKALSVSAGQCLQITPKNEQPLSALPRTYPSRPNPATDSLG